MVLPMERHLLLAEQATQHLQLVQIHIQKQIMFFQVGPLSKTRERFMH